MLLFHIRFIVNYRAKESSFIKTLICILSNILSSLNATVSGQGINSEEKYSHFGELEYFSQEENFSLAEVRELEQEAWQTIPLDKVSFGFDKQHYCLDNSTGWFFII